MNIYIAGLVIFLTSLLVYCLAGALVSRPVVERLADTDRLPSDPTPAELAQAGYLPVEYLPGPPFAGASDRGYELVDTGPLLLMSDQAAAVQSHEREVRAMVAEAEAKIPPRWR